MAKMNHAARARAHLRLVANRRGKIITPAQREQRELAWMLYITEGYIANVEHALAVNAYTLTHSSLRLMRDTQRSADNSARLLRNALQLIEAR